MKKLDKMIVKSYVGPLLLTFVIAVFVLLMQFIWKYVDDIAGKGLSIGIIGELLLDASATFVPMALPIAVLFASIMTMGNLGEHYELVAIKSGGVPLWRAMMPMGFIVVILTVVAFLFANFVMPSAVLKYRTTLYDITRKKPALNIRPGEYYSDIEGFVIRVNTKDPDGKTLHDVTIYDHRGRTGQPEIVTARLGTMEMSKDERSLLFTLVDGCSYSETMGSDSPEAKPFTRIAFDTNRIAFDLSDFAFNKTDESIFQGGYQMMNLAQLDSNILRLSQQREETFANQLSNLGNTMPAYSVTTTDARQSIYSLVDSADTKTCRRVCTDATSRAERCVSDLRIHSQVVVSQSEYINRHYIEWHRKWTLSLACIVLFLVGAPFGSIVRKGGLGVPLVASVVFFVLYYVIGMIAEKAVREGALGPWGMWISTFVMLPVGIFLTYKAVQR